MKKLLTTITISALVGTSASNLKLVFTNNVVSHGFKSNQLNNKDIRITNENDTNPFISRIINIDTNERVTCSVTQNGMIYVGTAYGKGSLSASKLYKSTDGINFIEIKSWNQNYGKSNQIWSLAVDSDNNIYVGSDNDIYKNVIDADNFFVLIGTEGIVESLAVDSNNNIYAGTGYGLYKSTDGTEFIKVNANEVKSSVHSLYIFNDILYIGNNNGLYKSNNGIDFEQLKGIPNHFFVYSISIASDGTVYVGTGYGLYKSTDGINFSNNDIRGNVKTLQIINISTTHTGNIYIGTIKGLYKSNNGIDFKLVDIKTGTSNEIGSLAITNNTIYVGTYDKGLYAINLIERLIKISKPDTFDKSWPLYTGIVYNSAQKIDIKDNLVASAKLDGSSITIPTTNLDIRIGEHNLVLTLKDKKLASIFGGDSNTGQVTYKLWVKTSIDNKDIQYSTNVDDTDLTDLSLGFIADVKEGKTTYHNSPIIETKSKDETGTHNASLNIDFKNILIDYPNSFYVQGNVDSSNNFTVTGTHKTFSKNLSIQTDGIYHLHLVDMVGNNYDSYLELGESNWKLKGTFNDDTLNRLKNKLNVTVSLTDPKELAQVTGWLTNYDKFASNLFGKSLQENGKGFEQDIKKDLENDFKWFLKPLTYEPNNEPNFNDGIDKIKLNSEITKIAEQKLQDGLTKIKLFTEHLNVDTKNVVNKSTLDSYSIWIKGYDTFINNNKDQWINDVIKVSSRGFATKDQENTISNHIHSLDFKNYLQHVEWMPTTVLTTSSDYKQFIELDRLQNDTINWVNQKLQDINKAYQQAIKNVESGLNLHGYSISEILNGKQKPQIKSEIDNFADGQSYHDWLQSQANIKFHGWQLKIGLPIGLISLVVAVVAGCFIYRHTNPKYHGYWRGKKEAKLRKSNFKKNDIDKDNKSD